MPCCTQSSGSASSAQRFFSPDPLLTADWLCHEWTTGGHGRIEERTVRAADAAWLAERHPEWKALASIISVTAR